MRRKRPAGGTRAGWAGQLGRAGWACLLFSFYFFFLSESCLFIDEQ
jgi:hypothetical protein